MAQIVTLPKSKQSTTYKGMMWFDNTPKTESAMYIRFQTMPQAYSSELMKSYTCADEMELFSLICKWWTVRQA